MKKVGSYTKEACIGKGTFGEIYRAKEMGSEKLVALKEINMSKSSSKDREHALKEAEVLQTCRHGNIVQFVESFCEDNKLYIVMELCDGGNLRTRINKTNGLDEKECIYFLRQICSGLQYLHDQNIVHRDVKTTNILLQKQNGDVVAKIGDFGLVKVLNSQVNSQGLTLVVGSPYFMSPEMINGQSYDKNTDIWSLGCVAYEMATTDIPYNASKQTELKQKINKESVNLDKVQYSTDMKDLILAMMCKDKARRPSVREISKILEQHYQTTYQSKPQVEIENRPRRSHHLAKTLPARLPTRQVGEICTSSGYDTSSGCDINTSRKVRAVVKVPVEMTEDEKDWLDKAEQLQKDIQKRLGDKELLPQINEAIKRTRHMDNLTKFIVDMEELLGKEMLQRCKPDLIALWQYQTALLQKNFKIAWS